MKVYFQHDSPLDRLETEPDYTAGLPPETVDMYRRRMQQLRACLNEQDTAQAHALDMQPLAGRGAEFFSIFLCQGWRLAIRLMGRKPRQEVAVLEIIQVSQPARRAK